MALTLVLNLRFLNIVAIFTRFCRYQLKKLHNHKLEILFPESSKSSRRQGYEEGLPSPSLVPVPLMMDTVSSLVKEKLPVVEFNKSRRHDVGSSTSCTVCAICLSYIEGSEEIRELVNCSHVYHKECMDGWVDQGQTTCPLCRLKLLAPKADEEQHQKAETETDPWRSERMAYLFGEDCLFENFCRIY